MRVSTGEQNLDLQRDALERAGCERIYDDVCSGRATDRPGLAKALDVARENRLDRGSRFANEARVFKYLTLTKLQANAIRLHRFQSYEVGAEDMADDSSAQKVDLSRVAKIVSSYVAKNSIGVDQIGGLIATVHRTVSGLSDSAATPAPVPLAPAVPIRRSVQPDCVVCLECGFRGVALRRHLRVRHGLEVADYRARWKLSPDHAVTAPAYSVRRSTMAKELGLGRKPALVEASPAPKQRGRPRRVTAS